MCVRACTARVRACEGDLKAAGFGCVHGYCSPLFLFQRPYVGDFMIGYVRSFIILTINMCITQSASQRVIMVLLI